MSGGLAKGSICGTLLMSKGLGRREKIAVSISVTFKLLERNLKELRKLRPFYLELPLSIEIPKTNKQTSQSLTRMRKNNALCTKRSFLGVIKGEI